MSWIGLGPGFWTRCGLGPAFCFGHGLDDFLTAYKSVHISRKFYTNIWFWKWVHVQCESWLNPMCHPWSVAIEISRSGYQPVQSWTPCLNMQHVRWILVVWPREFLDQHAVGLVSLAVQTSAAGALCTLPHACAGSCIKGSDKLGWREHRIG